jgi:hypothetical protein
MTTMTTVGYGDITPTTDGERIFAMASMVVGGAFYGYLIGNISAMVAHSDLNATAYHERMDLAYSWIDYHRFPKEMRQRIIKCIKAQLKEKSAACEVDVVSDLSPDLQKDVGSFLIPDDIQFNPLFDGLPLNAISRLQRIVQKVSAEKGHHVTLINEAGTAMFIVHSGAVRMVQPDGKGGNLVRILNSGDSFGEEVITGHSSVYTYQVTAEQNVALFVIHEFQLVDLFGHMPDVMTKIIQNAEHAVHPAWKPGTKNAMD